MQQSTTVEFNKTRPEFFKELHKRVNSYFKERNITKYANLDMKIKSVFMLSLYTIPLVLMLTGVVSSFWSVTLMWVIMGFGMSGIGLSVMHDANHGSFSKSKTVNNVMGYFLNYIGGYHINWRIQHNVLHHSYTNVDGFDEDIEKPVMRFSPNQPNKKAYRFQAYYAPVFYGLLTFYWVFSKDIEQVIKYSKRDLLKTQNKTLASAMTEIILCKVFYIGLTIVLPIVLIDLPWWQTFLGFGLMHVISGMLLAFIFQSAHVLEETHFYKPDENGSVENNWAIHQLHTTANFAQGSRWFSWYVGGLNYQIEHHLFPNICHIHYRNLSKIVESTAKEYGVPYYKHKTFLGALRSHFSLLNKLGKGLTNEQHRNKVAA